MLVIRGPLAFSHFRIERWLTQINYLVPQVNSLSTEFIHFVDLEAPLSKAENQILTNLLRYNGYPTETLSESFDINTLLVVPKVGTISAWSNRAIEVIHQCGLHQVRRIERGTLYILQASERLTWGDRQAIADLLHDPSTETVFYHLEDAQHLFEGEKPRSVEWVDVLNEGKTALIKAGRKFGIDLLDHEWDYLLQICRVLGRNPTDVELITLIEFSCVYRQYKTFTAKWQIDHTLKAESMLSLLKSTKQQNPRASFVTYRDSTAVTELGKTGCFFVEPATHIYQYQLETIATVLTIIPCSSELSTSIATEIQNEIAIGRGAKTRGAFSGYGTSNLLIPNFEQPWEIDYGRPSNFASALEIILQAPVNDSQFNNEFGRPNLLGFFRTYEQFVPAPKMEKEVRGYHKPILITGGTGHIRQRHIEKKPILPGMKIIILGGPVRSMQLEQMQALSFNFTLSKNENPEMHRRCQEVIEACAVFGFENPIVAVYMIGKGGIAAVLPDLIDDEKKGLYFELRDIPLADASLSPLEIWQNEIEERYLVIIGESYLETFQKIAEREACPFAVIGQVTATAEVQLYDRFCEFSPIQLSSSVFFKKLFREQHCDASHENREFLALDLNEMEIEEAVFRLLRFPCIADKSFLVTICDRTASGLVARDAMVGPWQVPVADCVVITKGFDTYQGEAMAIGERAPLAIINPSASVRMAIGEAITNIAAASIGALSEVRLLTNWAGIADYQDENARLYDAIEAISLEFCPALGLTIPISQDALSMQTCWNENTEEKQVTAPLTVVVNAFAPVMDVHRTLTPALTVDQGETLLVFIDLSGGYQRLGQSALAQVFNQTGDSVPDVEDPKLLKNFFTVIQQLNLEGKLLAYHDRSDGGLFVTLCEMAFASHTGLQIDISALGKDINAILFNEELGVVVQIRSEDIEPIIMALENSDVLDCYVIGTVDETDKISIIFNEKVICSYERTFLQQAWSETSFHLQALRDNPRCAKKQYELIHDQTDPGLNAYVTFDFLKKSEMPMLNLGARPRVAILREQGTHGHVEMAAAFDKAQFECVDVHTNDLYKSHLSLSDFHGLAVCGGFSFGDVLGAGLGWAKKILFNANLRDQFEEYFSREDTFTLGIANGCQMLSGLRSLIPGAEIWPTFIQNYSEQFEGRLCLVEVQESPSILLEGMVGSRLPIPVACKEGRIEFISEEMQEEVLKQQLVTLRYVDNWGRKTQAYPANPSGSPLGITGLTTPDGRVTVMMPQPCRAFRTIQYSWHPADWDEDGPWLRLFQNARKWVK